MTEIKMTKRYPQSRTEDIVDAYMRGWNDALDAVQNSKFHIAEPQTNADQHIESVETMSCQECKRWLYDDRWGWFCPLKGQDKCKYEPKTEQTEEENDD